MEGHREMLAGLLCEDTVHYKRLNTEKDLCRELTTVFPCFEIHLARSYVKYSSHERVVTARDM